MKQYDGNGDACERSLQHPRFYTIEDADARISDLVEALKQTEDNLRIALDELRNVAIIDLGFGVPKWFCGGCASYGDGPDLIEHKPECRISTVLGERA